MIFDWLLYGLIIWGLAATLNATFFKVERATRFAAWSLTVPLFLVNMIALSALKAMRYYMMSESMGFHVSLRNPLDVSGALLFAWLFFMALRKSRKVVTAGQPGAATTQHSIVTPQPAESPENPLPFTKKTLLALDTSTVIKADNNDDEASWAAALTEFEGTSRRPGLWAKSFSEASGNEAVAKATYLRVRATELEFQRHALLSAHADAANQQCASATSAHISPALQARIALAAEPVDSQPMGKCPNDYCSTLLPLSTQECPKCGATFGGSGWNVIPLNTK